MAEGNSLEDIKEDGKMIDGKSSTYFLHTHEKCYVSMYSQGIFFQKFGYVYNHQASLFGYFIDLQSCTNYFAVLHTVANERFGFALYCLTYVIAIDK